ncbi:MAG TPA: L-threonylcarbamoyladenylate synthase [Rectinemataceae bacterium]|nr:L-threonylcarbamoyladenylate synthase [Rectinemataceae bacterium]
MEILDPGEENLRRAGALIAAGGLVALPTETVYGLGADAFNARAVARVFEAKARPSFDPLIVHIAALGDIDRVARRPSALARSLMEALWPGPLTLVLPKREELPDLVTSGLPTVAVRLPAHPVARAIIASSGTSVAAPSANPFGYISPTRAEHVARMLGDRVDLIIDGGPCQVGVESTVLDMTVEPPRLLRPGGMELSRIEAVIGEISTKPLSPATEQDRPAGPGLLDSHYAPRSPLVLLSREELRAMRPEGSARVGLLLFEDSSLEALGGREAFAVTRLLSPSGDLVEAAASLFAHMHELDALGLDEIWAERVPEGGLGAAINDRLHKASRK